MKKIILICVYILSINQCNAQKGKQKHPINKAIIKQKKMNPYQYLITKEFEKFISQSASKIHLSNGNFMQVKCGHYGCYYEEIIKNSYYKISKEFFPNGNIQRKGISFNQDTFQIGVWYEFNESGKLINQTNYDEGYDFTLEEVIKFAENQKDIRRYEDQDNVVFPKGEYILLNSGSYNTIRKEIRGEKKVWVIECNFSEREQSMIQNGKIVGREYIEVYSEFVLDGKTGNIISKKRIGEKEDIDNQSDNRRTTSFLVNSEEKNISPKPELGTAYTSQSELSEGKNIYQVYEGKYYTKAEWDEYYKTLSWLDRLFIGKS